MAKKKTLDEVLFSMEFGSLLGISNHLKDYQMAYFLNKLLGIELEREKDFFFFVPQKAKKNDNPSFLLPMGLPLDDNENISDSSLPYSFYTCVDAENHLMYILLSSRSDGVVLYEAFKTFDRLLFIFGRDHLEAARNILAFQKDIPNTLLMKLFDFSSILTKEVLSTKEEKSLQKTYDFLLDLLEEVEFYFMEIKSEDTKPKNIII